MKEIGEVWNVDGTGYAEWVSPIVVSAGPIALPQNGLTMGSADLSLAFLRWYGGTIAAGAKAPWGSVANAGGKVLADWEFEGNGNDSSGNSLTLALTPLSGAVAPQAYIPSPAYPPACSAGAQQSFVVGTFPKLDGSASFPLDGGNALAYAWSYLPSAQPGMPVQLLRWSSQSVVNPSIAGFVAGPVNLQLTVTDGGGRRSSCVVHDGAVTTNSAGDVVLPDARISQILGPLPQWNGARDNRMPWIDIISKQWADRLGGLQGMIVPGGVVTNFVDEWNIPQAGTASATQGSNNITGSGTSFQTVFCGGAGNTTPIYNTYFIGWYNYPIAGGGGGTGRRFYQVTGCPSQTSLTINWPWVPASQSGMQFALWTDAGFGSWANGSANINYYDNVAAFYAMYYRSGIDLYLQYARWLADRWWTNPAVLDRGNCHDGLAGMCVMPRITSLTGMFLRAIDQDTVAGARNSSPMWPGIRALVDQSFLYNVKIWNQYNSIIVDLRETAYNVLYVAMCAAYDPDAAHAAICRSAVNGSINTMWKCQRQPDGHWQGLAYQYGSEALGGGLPGLAAVTPGSNIVTISGGNWDPSWFPTQFFSVYNATDYTTRDSTYYNATYVDATHIQLDRAYADNCLAGRNSCMNRQWLLGNGWIGFGTQPFMLGIAGHAFNQAFIALSMDPQYATTAALAKSYVVDAGKWIAKSTLDGTGGTDPETRGAFYGVGYGVCTPGTMANSCRVDPVASRENMGEALGLLGLAYAYAPSPALQTAIDNVFTAAYAKNPSDPGYDGTYAQELDPLNNGAFWNTNNGKWLGFFWGMGRNAAYLGVR